ncbi:MAG TPA: cytochrome c [Nitrospiria bacterium]|nr:cytochrome c [Nitrospiria bacterium]
MSNGMTAVCVCGVLLFTVTPVFAADAAKGKVLYDRHCAICHGAVGKGNGPASAMMNPKPADFTGEKVKKESDTQLLNAIESGVPGTPMAAWKGTLSPEQMQDVLDYIRAFGK